MNMAPVQPLEVDALCLKCDPTQFSFKSTAELENLEEIIGQERAVEAIEFGIGIRRQGFNLFALGPNGTGKYTSVHQSLVKKAASEDVPSDWCYVYNFEHPHMPKAIQLPPGKGMVLWQSMIALVEELFAVISGAFESDEYLNQKRTIETEFQEMQERSLEALKQEAATQDIALIRTPAGLAFAPLKDKEVIKPDEFMELPLEQREQIESQIENLQQRLQEIIRQVPQWMREGRARVKQLNKEVASFAVIPLFEELKEKFKESAEVLTYLDAVQEDVIEHNGMFLESGDEAGPGAAAAALLPSSQNKESFANRYQVNVIVDNSQSQGAPVIYEPNPTYTNLVGRSEHIAQMGALMTDFTLLKPDGLVSTVALEPQAIPLEVKVVLLGDRMLYYLLHQNDPDFSELFKVAADFEDQMERNDDTNMAYARLIGTLARKEELRHFDPSGVARVIERSARMVGDSIKLSAHMQSVADLLREADYWAGVDGNDLVNGEHVLKAIEAQIRRTSRIEERMRESILRETVLIDTEGEKLGQINGLSVLMMGNYAFGKPSRITARVRMGSGEVVDIERQVELGGPLHSKGILILSSYLGSAFAADRPLSLSASLVFEQSYGGVDGDSASSAELYALLSALSRVPIRQSLAVTGSVNQHGQVQAIGGVNEKIEGFFEICRARDLTGDQGVLIPAANVKHLMLGQDVIDAVADDKFHIYAIDTIEQGIEVLTGVAAGEKDEEGHYPEGTINHKVVARLEEMAETQREFNRPPEDKNQEEAVDSEEEDQS
jgi:predicted ATP-dependent protease